MLFFLPFMANVLLISVAPDQDDAYHRLRASADNDPFGVHTITEDPAHADMILFAESWEVNWKLDNVLRHDYVRTLPSKCFLFCERPDVFPMLPGVYTNLTQLHHLMGRVRTGFYLWMYENPFVKYNPHWDDDMHLFSFVGSMDTAGIRAEINRLDHPRGYVKNTSAKSSSIWWEGTEEEKAQFRKEYAETCQRSKFILCPRGNSPSSVRMFETMKTGRVPVILSDAWVPPQGPEWETFSVRMPESQIAQIPARLESLEPQAPAMGERARQAWEAWFSPEVSFHRIVEWCLDIKRSRTIPEPLGRYLAYAHFLQPKYARQLASTWLGPVKRKARQLAGLQPS